MYINLVKFIWKRSVVFFVFKSCFIWLTNETITFGLFWVTYHTREIRLCQGRTIRKITILFFFYSLKTVFFRGLIVSAVRKQWPLYLNDAVSIFQSWQGGQSSGIIVMRPTGCPEEEVSAELYSRIQGQGGARQGGLHRCVSSLSASSNLHQERRGCLPTPRCHDPSVLCHRVGNYNHPATTDTDWICSDEEKMEAQKLETNLGTGTVRSFFFFTQQLIHMGRGFLVPATTRK